MHIMHINEFETNLGLEQPQNGLMLTSIKKIVIVFRFFENSGR